MISCFVWCRLSVNMSEGFQFQRVCSLVHGVSCYWWNCAAHYCLLCANTSSCLSALIRARAYRFITKVYKKCASGYGWWGMLQLLTWCVCGCFFLISAQTLQVFTCLSPKLNIVCVESMIMSTPAIAVHVCGHLCWYGLLFGFVVFVNRVQNIYHHCLMSWQISFI